MMGTVEITRVRQATRIVSTVMAGTRPCWVCANLLHRHRFTGCDHDRCPCNRRGLAPRHPAWGLAP